MLQCTLQRPPAQPGGAAAAAQQNNTTACSSNATQSHNSQLTTRAGPSVAIRSKDIRGHLDMLGITGLFAHFFSRSYCSNDTAQRCTRSSRHTSVPTIPCVRKCAPTFAHLRAAPRRQKWRRTIIWISFIACRSRSTSRTTSSRHNFLLSQDNTYIERHPIYLLQRQQIWYHRHCRHERSSLR